MTDAEYIKQFVKDYGINCMKDLEKQLLSTLELKKGSWFSMTQLIKTSLISAHFANTRAIYLDVFSCKTFLI